MASKKRTRSFCNLESSEPILPDDVKRLDPVNINVNDEHSTRKIKEGTPRLSLGVCSTFVDKELTDKLGERFDEICASCDVRKNKSGKTGYILYGSISALQKAEQLINEVSSFETEEEEEDEVDDVQSPTKKVKFAHETQPSSPNKQKPTSSTQSSYESKAIEKTVTKQKPVIDYNRPEYKHIKNTDDVVKLMLQKARQLKEETLNVEKGEETLGIHFAHESNDEDNEDCVGGDSDSVVDNSHRSNCQNENQLVGNKKSVPRKNNNKKNEIFVCFYCKYYSTAKVRLIRHTKRGHSKFMCKFCDEVYDDQDSVDDHQTLCDDQQKVTLAKSVTQEKLVQEINPTKVKSKEKKMKMLMCEFCPTLLPTRQLLEVHMSKMHGQEPKEDNNRTNNGLVITVKQKAIIDTVDQKADCGKGNQSRNDSLDREDIVDQSGIVKYYDKSKNKNVYKCPKCGFTSTGKGPVCHHLTRCKAVVNTDFELTGMSVGDYKCDKCNFQTMEKSVLTTHLEQCTGKYVASLKSANNEVKREYEFMYVGDLKCKKCKFRAMSESKLEKHIEHCTGETTPLMKQVKLKALMKKTKKNANELVFKLRMTVEEVAEATGTPYELLEQAISEYPEELKHNYKCEICGYISTKQGVERHKARAHTGVETELCIYCPRKFRKDWMLKSHMRDHYDSAGNLLKDTLQTTDDSSNASDSKNIDCDMCGLTMAKRYLPGHKIRHHFTEKGYQCLVCHLVFVESQSLLRHFLEHFFSETVKDGSSESMQISCKIPESRHSTQQGSFLCEKCGVGYKTQAAMINHTSHCGMDDKLVDFSYEKLFEDENNCNGYNLKQLLEASELFPIAYKYAHKCPQCTYTSTLKGLEKHVVRSHRRKAVSCPVCPRKFAREWQLREHMLGSHQNDAETIIAITETENDKSTQNIAHCELCNYSCSKQGFKAHTLFHQTDWKLFCIICRKNCSSVPMLRQHLGLHFKDGELILPKNEKYMKAMDRILQTGRDRASHYIHEDETGRILCDECGQEFDTASKLATHQKSHMRDRSQEFQITYVLVEKFADCSCKTESCMNKCTTQRVTVHEKRYVCPYEDCTSLQRKSSLMNRHIQTIHLKLNTCYCEECGKQYNCAKNLKLHIKKVHKQELNFECQLCYKRFLDNSKLKYHMDTHKSMEFRNDTATCHICGKLLVKKYLKHHLNQHTGVRPYECRVCPKTFTYRAGLNRHMQHIHNKIHPFLCKHPGCGASFAVPAKLKYHSTTHTGKSKYTCDFCKKVFTQACTLKKHQQLHCPQLEDSKRALRLSSVLEQERIENEQEEEAEAILQQFTSQHDQAPEETMMAVGNSEGILQEPYEQIYMCSVCNKTFADITEIETHLISHEQQQQQENMLKHEIIDYNPQEVEAITSEMHFING